MCPRKRVGDGTVVEAGTSATQGDAKRGSVVAAAIDSREPGSGVSKPSAPRPTVSASSAPAAIANRHFFMGAHSSGTTDPPSILRSPGGKMTSRIFNFNAGPGVLPEPVLEEAQRD